ncbi:MAG TPA: hypothetical protein DEG47_11970 [Cyanobacteria bacterium UBA11148]|nr:hypothetical protein [Cyanobacteria bacterium UBA11148]
MTNWVASSQSDRIDRDEKLVITENLLVLAECAGLFPRNDCGSVRLELKPEMVTGDSWYSNRENLKFLKNQKVGLMMGNESRSTD